MPIHCFYALSIMFLIEHIKSSYNDLYCKISYRGEQYTGMWNITDLGVPCQDLIVTVPHFHLYDKSQRVYCRNKNGKLNSPWCLTQSPIYRYRPCPVPYCDEQSCRIGTKYNGYVSETITGKQCQDWNTFLDFTNDNWWNFPDRNNLHTNCRNPNADKDGPWCFYWVSNIFFTTEPCFVNMEFCEETNKLTDCKESDGSYSGTTSRSYTSSCFPNPNGETVCTSHLEMEIPSCYINSTSLDYCPIPYCRYGTTCKDTSTNYFYGRDFTEDNSQCLYWNYTRMRRYYNEFPENHTNHNYCRNPLSLMETPWCFVNKSGVIINKECFGDFCSFKNILSKPECSEPLDGIVSDNYDILALNSNSCENICRISIAQNGRYLELKTASDIDFTMEFKLLVDYKDNSFFRFEIISVHLDFFVCAINGTLKVVDKEYENAFILDCTFTAVCKTTDLLSNWNLYHLIYSDTRYYCVNDRMQLTQDLSDCQLFAIVKHPYAFDLNDGNSFVNQLSVFVDQNALINPSGIFKISILYTCPYYDVSLNINLSSKYSLPITQYCSCVCYFQYFVKIEFKHGGQITYKFEIKMPGTNISCLLNPIPDNDYPFIFIKNQRDLFNFTISSSHGDSLVQITSNKYGFCIMDDDRKQNHYYVDFPLCCTPPCYISINVTLKTRFNRMLLGRYQLLYLPSKLFEWIPSLNVLLIRDRILFCKINRNILVYDIFLYEMLSERDGWNLNLIYTIDTGFPPGFIKLSCTLSMIGLLTKVKKIIKFMNMTYLLVKPFNAVILDEMSSLKLLTCTADEQYVNYYSLFGWVGFQTPIMFDRHMISVVDCELGQCLTLLPGASFGQYNFTCYVSMLDFHSENMTHFIYLVKKSIVFEYKENFNYQIKPDNHILFPNESVSCYSLDAKNESDVVISLSDKNNRHVILSSIRELVVPSNISIDIYTISCGLINETTNGYYQKRYIFKDPFRLEPDLPFYTIRVRTISCIPNANIRRLSGVNITAKLVGIDGMINVYDINSPNTINLNDNIKPGNHTILCQMSLALIYDSALPIRFSPYGLKPIFVRFTIYSVFKLKIRWIAMKHTIYLNEFAGVIAIPFNKYIKDKDLYFNWTATFFGVSKLIFKSFQSYNQSSTAYFFSHTTPGHYIIRVTLSYWDWDIFQNFYLEQQVKSYSTYLSGYKSFVIVANTDVFITTDRLCCVVDNVVPVSLSFFIYFEKQLQKKIRRDTSICYNINYLPLDHSYFLRCVISFNQYSTYIQRKILFLSTPTILYFDPLDALLGNWITCFPYKEIFDYDSFDNISINVNWTIISMPPTDMDLFIGTGIELISYSGISIRISESYSPFGLYVLKCELNATLQNKTYILNKKHDFNLEGFGTPLIIGPLATIRADILFPLLFIFSFLFAYLMTFLVLAFGRTTEQLKNQKMSFFLSRKICFINKGKHKNESIFKKHMREYYITNNIIDYYIFEGLFGNICYCIAQALSRELRLKKQSEDCKRISMNRRYATGGYNRIFPNDDQSSFYISDAITINHLVTNQSIDERSTPPLDTELFKMYLSNLPKSYLRETIDSQFGEKVKRPELESYHLSSSVPKRRVKSSLIANKFMKRLKEDQIKKAKSKKVLRKSSHSYMYKPMYEYNKLSTRQRDSGSNEKSYTLILGFVKSDSATTEQDAKKKSKKSSKVYEIKQHMTLMELGEKIQELTNEKEYNKPTSKTLKILR